MINNNDDDDDDDNDDVFRLVPQGETLLNSPNQGVHAEGVDLYLEGVSRSSSGEYRCAATNSEGEVVSDPLYLNVRGELT